MATFRKIAIVGHELKYLGDAVSKMVSHAHQRACLLARIFLRLGRRLRARLILAQQLGAGHSHFVDQVQQRLAARFDSLAAMLDKLHIGIHRQHGCRSGTHHQLERQQVTVAVMVLSRANHRQHWHAGDMQDVVLIALALPVFDVQVRQFHHQRLCAHQAYTLGVERHKRDHVQACNALIVFAVPILGLAVNLPGAWLKDTHLLNNFDTKVTVILGHGLKVAKLSQLGAVIAPAENLHGMNHDDIRAKACCIFLGLGAHAVSLGVLNQGIAQSVGKANSEPVNAPGAQVVALAVNVRCKIFQLVRYVITELNRLSKHPIRH